METSPIVVDKADCEELRLMQGAYNELLMALGQTEIQIKAAQDQKDALHVKIAHVERQVRMTKARVQNKYGLADNAQVNLENGAIE